MKWQFSLHTHTLYLHVISVLIFFRDRAFDNPVRLRLKPNWQWQKKESFSLKEMPSKEVHQVCAWKQQGETGLGT